MYVLVGAGFKPLNVLEIDFRFFYNFLSVDIGSAPSEFNYKMSSIAGVHMIFKKIDYIVSPNVIAQE